jgi:hypothetical protein
LEVGKGGWTSHDVAREASGRPVTYGLGVYNIHVCGPIIISLSTPSLYIFSLTKS